MKNQLLTLTFLLYFISFQVLSKEYKISTLKDLNPAKISLRCDTSLLLPGTLHTIGFVVFTEEGKILHTRGLLKGSLRWNNFIVEVENAKFLQGFLSISKTNTEETLRFIPFKISTKYQLEKVFYDTLWLNYEREIIIFPISSFKRIPGAKVKFGLQVIYDNDQDILYETTSAVRKVLKSYEVLVKGGKHDDGAFIISSDVFDHPDHTPGFLVQLKKDTTIHDIFDIQLDYKERYNYNGSGSSGMFGSSGFSGSSGSTGNHGQAGQDGEHGSNGAWGNEINVFTDVYFDSILNQPLIRVVVDNLTRRKLQYYLLNPNGGSFTIHASGGNGGSGGNAGNGGNGGKGYEGEYFTEYIKETIIKKDTAGKEYKVEITKQIQRQGRGGDGGFGGPGGYGGIGGEGGEGGYITIYYTIAAKKYLNLIKTYVGGGSGGWGGTGGSGGRGGSGGDGNPKGRQGGNEQDGLNGARGYDGNNGKLDMRAIEKVPW
ncbi:MAG: hypothetical protein Q7U47_00370 [Paludibacter sp.]|nr:hypothetical protein [Paludibacter sp.]